MEEETAAVLDPEPDTALRHIGGAVEIKSMTDTHAILAGYGVIFGGVDLYGDTFTEETDFKYSNPNAPVFYDHTLTGIDHDIGVVVKTKKDKFGIWMESQIDLSKTYAKQVLELAEKGILGYSTGAISHLVRREGKYIKSWAIGELSLTPTPAEPRTVGVGVVKSATEAMAEAESPQTTAEGAATGSIEVIDNKEDSHMSDETERVAALETKFDAFSARIDAVLKHIEESPAIRKAGIVSETGGKSDKTRKSFADFLTAVKRKDVTRLNGVYGTHNQPLDEDDELKMSSEDGASGGFLVPEEYIARLMQIAGDSAIVRPRAMLIPVGTAAGSIPALDQRSVTGGQGDTAFAGGVVATWEGEAATIDETEPNFNLINFRVHKMAGITKVPNELNSDSAINLEALLTRLFGVAIGAKEDYSFLFGNGVGKPLGMLVSPAAVGVDADTNDAFVYADAMEISSRFRPVTPGGGLWVAHKSALPDIGRFEVGTGGAVWMANLVSKEPANLLGYPLLWSEHMAQTNNPYDVALIDPSAYVIFDRQDLRIAFSEHAYFTTDQVAWRFTKRIDGRPWLAGATELSDATGNFTVSPFVYNND